MFLCGVSLHLTAAMKSMVLPALLISMVVLYSCQPPRYIYTAAPPNNPYFRQKGESKVAAYYSTSSSENELEDEYDNGMDLQAALALSDHWALTADYFKRDEKQVATDADEPLFQNATIRYDRKITSFGTGYFMPVNPKKTIVFNTYGGIGFGDFSFDDYGLNNGVNYSRFYKNNITKWYVQPSVNFFAGQYFRSGFITKFSWVRYRSQVTNYTPAELDYLGLTLLRRTTLSFLEITFDFQVTFEQMKWMHFDAGFTICSDPAIRKTTNLEARNLNASIGLSFDFSKMIKSK
jgi:hypothetical protein